MLRSYRPKRKCPVVLTNFAGVGRVWAGAAQAFGTHLTEGLAGRFDRATWPMAMTASKAAGASFRKFKFVELRGRALGRLAQAWPSDFRMY